MHRVDKLPHWFLSLLLDERIKLYSDIIDYENQPERNRNILARSTIIRVDKSINYNTVKRRELKA